MIFSPELLNELTRLSTPLVCNAIEAFNLRLRHEGYMDGSVISRIAPPQSMAGYAITMQMRTDKPPIRGLTYEDRNDWWESLTAFPVPRILVIQDVGAPGKGSVAGEIHGAIFKALGCTGIVTNGAVRDLEALEAMQLHIYSGSIAPSHAYAHLVDIGSPVEIGGLTIKNGDLLHGDRHGIVNIPVAIAGDIPARAQAILHHEEAILSLCASPEISIEKLRELVAPWSRALGEAD